MSHRPIEDPKVFFENVRNIIAAAGAIAPAMIRPLISFDGDRYVVDSETASWLAERESPFAVVACAGKFRTGKSFLLNRLLDAPPGKGFGVGESVQACTRGIWVSTEFLSSKGKDVLVMDTEGIDALDAESDHDVRIFALAVLLSSTFVYNSMSHLDEPAVQTLSLMTRVAESVGESHSPTLHWVLRDFALDMVDSNQKPITKSQYLEQALDPLSSKCATREAIKSVFKDRNLVTLPRPHKGDTANKLDQKGNWALQARFASAIVEFRNSLAESKEFCVAGVPLTGKVYVEHVRNLVHKINESNCIPKVEDSWSLLSKVQHAEEENRARLSLLSKAEAECQTGTEDAVRLWIRGAIPALSFLPPQPDCAQVQSRIEEEVFRHAKALGKVKDVQSIANALAEEAMSAFSSSGHDVSSLSGPWDDAEVGNAFRLSLLSKLMGCIPSIQLGGEERGKEEARREGLLEAERMRAEVESLKAEVESLKASPPEPPSRSLLSPPCKEDASTSTDDLFPMDAASVDSFAETEAMLQEGKEAAEKGRELAEVKRREAEDRLSSAEEREESIKEMYSKSMQELVQESVAKIDAANKSASDAKDEARRCVDQKKAVQAECDKLRSLAKEAQERAIDVHKSMLEELRRRDAEAKEQSNACRKEQMETHARAESASVETRALKRRVDELLDCDGEAKRLRTEAQQAKVERARDEAQKDSLSAQLKAAREEAESLRSHGRQLEGKLAVLEATAKLETCKRELMR